MASESNHQDALRDLYPTLSDEELKLAEENLRRYVAVVWEIERKRLLRAEVPGIDTPSPSPTIEERSNVSLTT